VSSSAYAPLVECCNVRYGLCMKGPTPRTLEYIPEVGVKGYHLLPDRESHFGRIEAEDVIGKRPKVACDS